MALEDRVKALETELKVLKNEIQTTLLSIQEQVLIHYYPSLRSESPAPAAGRAPRVSENGQKSAPVQTPVSAEGRQPAAASPDVVEAGVKPPEASQALPKAHLATLDEVRKRDHRLDAAPAAAPQPPAAPELRAAQVAPPSARSARTAFTSLLGWVGNSVAALGQDRTQKAIEIYARGQHLDPDVKDLLQQLAALSQDNQPPQQVGIKQVIDVLYQLNDVLDREIGVGGAEPSDG